MNVTVLYDSFLFTLTFICAILCIWNPIKQAACSNLQSYSTGIAEDVDLCSNATEISTFYLFYLIFLLFVISVYDPVLPVITVSKLVGPHKLDVTKISSSLGNYASDFCRDKQVYLNRTRHK